MTVETIGYGAGQKEFPQPNILRLLVGTAAAKSQADGPQVNSPRTEAIVLLETNIDNASGELVGHAVDRLWVAGALDVSLATIQMKKGRPGVVVSVQARPDDADELEAVLFSELPTLGVRRATLMRTALARQPHEVKTRWGTVVGKIVYSHGGALRFAPEYESCLQIAVKEGVALADVVEAAKAAFTSS
jgi:uncharacterized protein (DUF111 family)